MADFYELLGVSTATADELKRAYLASRPASCIRTPTRRRRGRGVQVGSRAYEVLSDPSSGPATTASARPASPAPGGGATFDDILRGRRRRSVQLAVRWRAVRRRRPPRSERPARGQDMEAVATISFEQAVFGATVAGHAAPPAAVHRLRRQRRRKRAPSRSRASSAAAPVRCSVSARACSGRWSRRRRARAAAGSARSSSRPCPTCRARAGHARAHVPGRRPRRCRQRLDAAALRPRRGRAARWGTRRPLRPPASRPHERYLRDGDDLVTAISDLDRPGGARHDGQAADARRRRGDRRARRARSRARSSCSANVACPRLQGRGRGDLRPSSSSRCRRSCPTRRPSCSASSPSCAAKRSARPRRGSSRASSRRSSRDAVDEDAAPLGRPRPRRRCRRRRSSKPTRCTICPRAAPAPWRAGHGHRRCRALARRRLHR